jgi:hypothetical protein
MKYRALKENPSPARNTIDKQPLLQKHPAVWNNSNQDE